MTSSTSAEIQAETGSNILLPLACSARRKPVGLKCKGIIQVNVGLHFT